MAEAARLDELADSLPAPPVEAADVGGDNVNADDGRNGTVSPEAEPPSPSPSDDADPLDKLLSQWDEDQNRNNGAAAPSSDDDIIAALDAADRDAAAQARNEQEFAAAAAALASESAQSALELAQRDYENNQLRQTVGARRVNISKSGGQHQWRMKADLNALVTPVQKDLEAEGLATSLLDFVETQLIAEAVRDPTIEEAFQAKYFQGQTRCARTA